jgi:hypothetical protein
VENLGGHKLPTAYPSRRAWLHIVVREDSGRVVFESGALRSDGSIDGNENDSDAKHFEPHYREIREPNQVQIYESILQDSQGGVTTGLLSAVGYVKDNRLLPHGFESTTASADIAVRGDAAGDPNFTDHGQKLLLSADVRGASGPFSVTVELLYQPIGYRWAQNLKSFKGAEISRFTDYFDSLKTSDSTIVLATGVASSVSPK